MSGDIKIFKPSRLDGYEKPKDDKMCFLCNERWDCEGYVGRNKRSECLDPPKEEDNPAICRWCYARGYCEDYENHDKKICDSKDHQYHHHVGNLR